MPAKKASVTRSTKTSKGVGSTVRSAPEHKRTRAASEESSSSTGSHHSVGGAAKQRKTRSRFEDFDVAEAIKNVELPNVPVVAGMYDDANGAGAPEAEAVHAVPSAHEPAASQTADVKYRHASDEGGVPGMYDCHDSATESGAATAPPIPPQKRVEPDRISDDEDSVDHVPQTTTQHEIDLNEEMVPLAAIIAVDIDRATEANEGGLLKEPAPPVANIPRVTKEDEGAPPMPTALMELLSA